MSLAIEERSELSQRLAANLSAEYELFAVQVASGLSYRASAKVAGFSEDNGFRLMQIPQVRTRVAELLEQPETRVKAGILAEFMMLRNRAADADLNDEQRANVDLRLRLLMAHAKVLGMVIERKQVQQSTASIQLDKLPPDAIRAHLSQLLGRLEPGAQADVRRLIESGDVTDVECISAEPEPAEGETKAKKVHSKRKSPATGSAKRDTSK